MTGAISDARAALVPVVVVRENGRQRTLYGLQPKQLVAFAHTPINKQPWESYPRHIGYGGAAGGGKSHLARAVSVAAAFRWPGSTGIIFRRTKPEVKTNHIFKFRSEVPEKIDGTQLWSWNGEDLCATFNNGSRIFFGYLKDEDDLLRYQGSEYDYMVFEESTHYEWKLVRWLTGNRLRATVDAARPFVLYPSNPGNIGHHWYKRLFITRKYYSKYNERPDQYVFVQAKVEDNLVLLERDPEYLRELDTLPEPYRSWMRDGDWEAGMGLALPMVSPDVHLVEPFKIPDNWTVFGAFDWGFAHPFSFGIYAVNEDGRRFKLDTVTSFGQQPAQIAQLVTAACTNANIPPLRIRWVSAGHDCWADKRSMGENVPTIAETFLEYGYTLVRANISRVAGLNNLRKWLTPDPDTGIPGLVFFDTPGNRKCVEQLETMPVNPDNPEDSHKIDADEFGHGGDDMYDETRYAMADRAPPSRSAMRDRSPGAWSKETLAAESERNRLGKMPHNMRKTAVLHPEFGDML